MIPLTSTFINRTKSKFPIIIKKRLATSELTSQEIVQEVLKGGVFRERITGRVLECYKGYIHVIKSKNNVPYEVVADAYVEAVTQLISHISNGRFEPKYEKSCSTYIYSITRNKCIDYIRKEVRRLDVEFINDSEDSEKYEGILEREKLSLQDILDEFGSQLGKNCQEILELYVKGYNPKEIANILNIQNPNAVSARRSKCIKDLKKLLKESQENK